MVIAMRSLLAREPVFTPEGIVTGSIRAIARSATNPDRSRKLGHLPKAATATSAWYAHGIVANDVKSAVDAMESMISRDYAEGRCLLPNQLLGAIYDRELSGWSERQDLNLRPLVPQTSALPGCATLRNHRIKSAFHSRALAPKRSKPHRQITGCLSMRRW